MSDTVFSDVPDFVPMSDKAFVVEHRVTGPDAGTEAEWHMEFAFPVAEIRDEILHEAQKVTPSEHEYRATETKIESVPDHVIQVSTELLIARFIGGFSEGN